MSTSHGAATAAAPAADDGARRDRLRHALVEAAHYLPAQAPLGAFVHHNTLHAFEHLPFHEGVAKGYELFGAEPYASEAFFRQQIAAGRITPDDVERALSDIAESDDPLAAGLTVGSVRRLMLLYGSEDLDGPALRWAIREQGLLDRYPEILPRSARKEALRRSVRWLRARLEREGSDRVIAALTAVEGADDLVDHLGLRLERNALEETLDQNPEPVVLRLLFGEARRLVGSASPEPPRSRRTRDRVLAATGVDVDAMVAPMLIRWTASYLDTGLAYWSMPDREQGFYRTVRQLARHSSGLPTAWMGDLRRELRRQEEAGMEAEDVVLHCLEDLGIPEEAWFETLRGKLLALPGWPGMMHHLEMRPQNRMRSFPYSLMDYVAVMLTLHEVALRHVLRRDLASGRKLRDVLASLPAPPPERPVDGDTRAHALFCVLRDACLDLPRVAALGEKDGAKLLAAIEEFGSLQRRAILQEAYEGHYVGEILDGIDANARAQRRLRTVTPRLQVAFCIDDREESFRRYLEELDPAIETFGFAGFYGFAIAYTGLTGGHPEPLCPVVRDPSHAIHEVPRDPAEAERWRRRYERAGRLGFAREVGARGTFRGFGFSVAGVMDAIPMVLRVTAPRMAHRLRSGLTHVLLRPPPTRLTSLRTDDSIRERGLPVGFTAEEAAERIGTVLEDMGLSQAFAPLVILLGHGSTSSNNPHEAAYECGACGGGKGGPNARLFADLANRDEVREALRRRGIDVPATTWFVGGLHDTCSDAIDLADLDRVPESHRAALEEAIALFDRVRPLNSHERLRRFETVPLDLTPEQALRYAEGRSQNLAEPRPEYGHCTNSVCYVGRRWLTRGLFLDRRAFLVSYDPATDPDGTILTRLLSAAAPVGAGISLEYYFSTVDKTRYGAGSKLPHNVTGLIGVMNGHESDLRTGLPEQMVAIHEPMRLLVVVEATPVRLLAVAARLPEVKRLVENRWILLVAMDPDTSELWVLTPRGFEPYVPRQDLPVYPTSTSYYHGRRDHLEPVRVLAGLEGESRHA